MHSFVSFCQVTIWVKSLSIKGKLATVLRTPFSVSKWQSMACMCKDVACTEHLFGMATVSQHLITHHQQPRESSLQLAESLQRKLEDVFISILMSVFLEWGEYVTYKWNVHMLSEGREREKEIQPYFKPLLYLVHSGREDKRGKEEGEIRAEWKTMRNWEKQRKKEPERKEEKVN